MTIYTKTGDNGTTSTFGGSRVPKCAPQIEAYGTIDELTSFIGLVSLKVKDKNNQTLLIQIQEHLYQIMSFLAGAKTDFQPLDIKLNEFEKSIDKIQSELPKLNHFIIPGGTELSSWLHILRTITRRAERQIVAYFFQNKSRHQDEYSLIIRYFNRLSDLFFVLARSYNEKDKLLK